MDTQYILKQGKLVPCMKKRSKKTVLSIVFLLCLSAFFTGGYMLAFRLHGLPKGNIAITKTEYEHLLQSEDTLAQLSEKIDAQTYELSPEKLKEVFLHTFPEVKLNDELLDQYLTSVLKWSAEYSIPPLLVLSVIWRESFFDASIISNANARGPMQVIYKYHKEKLDRLQKSEQDLHDIDVGIHVGIEILREYFDRYDRDLFRAMTAYVGGSHRTYAQDIITRYFNARMYLEEQL